MKNSKTFMKKILLISFLFAALFAKGQQGTIPSAAHIVAIGGGLNADSATQIRTEIRDTSIALKVFMATNYVPYSGAITTLDMGSNSVNAKDFKVNGTNGAGHVSYKHQNSAAIASANETSLFANSSGNIAWQNGNSYLTTLTTSSNTANRNYTFQNKDYTVANVADSLSTTAGLGVTISTPSAYNRTITVDTSSASILSRQRAANTYTLISDTSLFSRKQMPSYSIRVNNTNATANATTDNFRTVGETSLAASDTVTWTGSTAPSGGTSNTYRWTQIGNRVWVDITLSNTSNGSGITGVTVKLPTSLPTPAKPTGQTAANTYMYPVNAVFVSSTNVTISAAARGGIRNNSVNNAYEMAITTSSQAPATGIFSFTYTTN